MPRGIDHIVHAVHDLDAAAALYARLGFQVGARNRHAPEWGTQNHVVQLPGTFVELLTVADASGIVPHGKRLFSFGAHNRDFLARRQGLSMLVVEGHGAADAEHFRTVGIGDFEPYNFEREARRPDGTAVKVAFTLAFAADAKTPDIGFFTCRHRYPENFWNPAFQVHGNTAVAVSGITMVADDPAAHRAFLSAFMSEDAVAEDASMGIKLMAGRGSKVAVIRPATFRRQFGFEAPETHHGAQLAALHVAVRDLSVARDTLRANRVPYSEQPDRVLIGPQAALGATLVLEAAG